MNHGDADKMFSLLGVRSTSVSGTGWIRAQCPFAPITHAKGTDQHPSFAVSIGEGVESSYTCKSCGHHGPVKWIAQKMIRMGMFVPPSLHELVQRTNMLTPKQLVKRMEDFQRMKSSPITDFAPDAPVRKAWAHAPVRREAEKMEILDESLLDSFEPLPPEQEAYLAGTAKNPQGDQKKYGFAPNILAQWEICWKETATRIAVPIRDGDGNLVGVSGRSWRAMQKPKYLHSSGFKRDQVLYGYHFRDLSWPTCYLVEGFFDAIHIQANGWPNAFCIMGVDVSKEQADMVCRDFKSVVLFFDGDKAGKEGLLRSIRLLKGRIDVRVVAAPDGKDPDDLSVDELREILGPRPVDTEQSHG